MRSILVRAIQEKRILRLTDRESEKTVEPHAYGLNREGKPTLLCYQLDEEPGGHPGWKMLALGASMIIMETEAVFARPRPGYRRNDTAMLTVIDQV